jgi:hypothetical protein
VREVGGVSVLNSDWLRGRLDAGEITDSLIKMVKDICGCKSPP